MIRASKKQGATTKTRRTAGSKKNAGKGAVSLREIADGTLSRSSEEITASLLKSTLAGDVDSVRLLVSLADGAGQSEDSGLARLKVSLANAWAAEPQWQGEKSESAAETEGGSREPEG